MADKKPDHYHIRDIPPRLYPRNTKAREYARDLDRLVSMLGYTNRKVQYCAQICSLNIKSITQKNGRLIPSPPETFKGVQDFVYHYENYCYRLYSYREKILQFINAVLPVGYTEKQVRLEHIVINPIVKQAGLLPYVSKFQKNTSLSKVVRDRKMITHQLYYGVDFDHYFRPKLENKANNPVQFKKWVNDWHRQIVSRAKLTSESTFAIGKLDNEVAEKVIDYREKIKKSSATGKPRARLKEKQEAKITKLAE